MNAENLEREKRVFLEEAGRIVQGQSKRLVPVDSGRLRNSISMDVKRDVAIVGTNVEYAPYVEYGTRRQSAQPYLRPALDMNRKPLTDLWRSHIRRALGGQ
jgi:HK97 gp10 family phage protein